MTEYFITKQAQWTLRNLLLWLPSKTILAWSKLLQAPQLSLSHWDDHLCGIRSCLHYSIILCVRTSRFKNLLAEISHFNSNSEIQTYIVKEKIHNTVANNYFIFKDHAKYFFYFLSLVIINYIVFTAVDLETNYHKDLWISCTFLLTGQNSWVRLIHETIALKGGN